MQRLFLIGLMACTTLTAWGLPEPEDFYVRESFPDSAAFGWVGLGQANGQYLIWNGDQVYRQVSDARSKLEVIAEGYIGDPAFIIGGRTQNEVILGSGLSGNIYFLNIADPQDFVPGTELNVGSHFSGTMLSSTLLAVDQGDFGFPSEIAVIDISDMAVARMQSVMDMPMLSNTRDVIIQKPDGSFSANLITNNARSLLYVTDSGNGQIKTFPVTAIINAFNDMETVDWDTEGTDFGAPFEFPLGGVYGFTRMGNPVLAGFGSIVVVHSSTHEILHEFDPAGTGPFYTLMYNFTFEDMIAVDASIPSVVYPTRNGLLPRRPCDDDDAIRDEYDTFVADFMPGDDLDMDGIPDTAMLELAILASCQGTDDVFTAATMLAYEQNLSTIENEAGFRALSSYEHLLAVLMLMSQDMQDAVRAIPGITLAGAYAIVMGADEDNFLPAFGTGPGTYVPDPMLVFEEAFIGSNDPDFDGFTNTEEYDNVVAIGGDIIDFAINAFSPKFNGNGNAGSSGNCFIATAAFGTPLAPEIYRLRVFRDRHLLTTTLGTAFTDAYYHVSPPVADYIAARPILRSGVRGGIYGGLWTMEHPIAALSCVFLFSFGFFYRRSKRAHAETFRGSGSA